jgi:preprotein translocase subunit YajC
MSGPATADPDDDMDALLDFFVSPAWAQAQSQGSNFSFLFMMIALFAVVYFLMIRPQNKKQKEHRQMVEALTAGDEIVTAGGVLGKVKAVGEQFLEVEVASNVTIKLQRHTVAAVLPKGTVKSA